MNWMNCLAEKLQNEWAEGVCRGMRWRLLLQTVIQLGRHRVLLNNQVNCENILHNLVGEEWIIGIKCS